MLFCCSLFQVNESVICHTCRTVQHSFTRFNYKMDGTKKKRECALGQFTRHEKKLREALEKIYEELKVRYKDAERAHDEYVIQLDDETDANSEEAWIQDLTARFDKLELEVGELISSQLQGKNKHSSEDVQIPLGGAFAPSYPEHKEKLLSEDKINEEDISQSVLNKQAQVVSSQILRSGTKDQSVIESQGDLDAPIQYSKLYQPKNTDGVSTRSRDKPPKKVSSFVNQNLQYGDLNQSQSNHPVQLSSFAYRNFQYGNINQSQPQPPPTNNGMLFGNPMQRR